jgi:hypothetical protein
MKRGKPPALGCLVLGYLRFGPPGRAHGANSPQGQVAALTRFASACGIQLDAFVIDAGVSGSLPPVQRRAQAEPPVQPHRDENVTVLACKRDRLFRDGATMPLWDTDNVSLVVIDRQIDIRESIGQVLVAMFASVAEVGRLLAGERTLVALVRLEVQAVIEGKSAPSRIRGAQPCSPR